MVRYVIAAVVACLYVAGSIWVVRSEGQAYRQGLIKPKLAAGEIEKSAPALPEKEYRAAPPVAVSNATKEKAAPKRAAKHSPKAQSSIALAKATPAKSPARDPEPAQPPRALTLADNPLAHNEFWNQPALTQSWDLAALKPRDESRLGDEFHGLLVQLNLIDEESPLQSRVEEAAEPFLKTLIRKEIKYKPFILNSDAVSAFSTPGGYIYVSRGLFDLIGEEEDYALQFAIGHEMAHVDREHAIKCLQDPDVKKMTQGTLQKLYWLIIPFGYLVSDKVDQEFEADEWVSNKMQRFGRSRREILLFLQKLEGYAKKNGFENGRAKPKPGRDVSPLENHYRSQTAVRKRLKHLKEFIDGAGQAAK
jgi:hypothetical protein